MLVKFLCALVIPVLAWAGKLVLQEHNCIGASEATASISGSSSNGVVAPSCKCMCMLNSVCTSFQ